MAGEQVDVTEFLGKESSIRVSYNRRDLILYALGIGCDELSYTYEGHDDFAAFPTYPIVLNFKGADTDVVTFPSPAMMDSMVVPPLPGTRVGLDGERFLEVINPLPTEETELQLTTKLIGVHKRGKGALAETETILKDPSTGKLYTRIISGAFLVGAKDFTPESAGVTNSKNIEVPKREPDRVVESQPSHNQTQLYRLSGDYNPLHVDPTFAQMSGFEQPILHGLCSLGFTAHAVLREFGGNDPNNFKSVRCRFASPVIPGETLVIKMWLEGNTVILQVSVKERDIVVINNAALELHAIKPAAKL